jgi:hypothetical protein
MEIIVYSSLVASDEQRLISTLKFSDIDVLNSLEHLRDRLNVPTDLRKIVILFVRNEKEVAGISDAIKHFSDLLSIIVLYSQDPETLKKVNRLRPRYIALDDSDFQDVAAVIKRMDQGYGLQQTKNRER